MAGSISKALWLVPIVALVFALFPLPYGYYQLLRIGLCGVIGYLALREWQLGGGQVSAWVWVLGLTALIYNPVFPLHMTRGIWSIINIATIAVLAAHMGARRRG